MQKRFEKKVVESISNFNSSFGVNKDKQTNKLTTLVVEGGGDGDNLDGLSRVETPLKNFANAHEKTNPALDDFWFCFREKMLKRKRT